MSVSSSLNNAASKVQVQVWQPTSSPFAFASLLESHYESPQAVADSLHATSATAAMQCKTM